MFETIGAALLSGLGIASKVVGTISSIKNLGENTMNGDSNFGSLANLGITGLSSLLGGGSGEAIQVPEGGDFGEAVFDELGGETPGFGSPDRAAFEAANADYDAAAKEAGEFAAETNKGFLANAWDSVKGAGEQMGDRLKGDIQKRINSHIVREPDGSINTGKTAGNVAYSVLRFGAERALSNVMSNGKQAAQTPAPQAQLPETKAPQARTPDADEALKQLMNMMHNS